MAKNFLDNLSEEQTKRYNTIAFFLKGFMVCGECGRKITAERKKGRYVYYKCTRYKTACSKRAVSEEDLIPQAQDTVKKIGIPHEAVVYVADALKESLQMKRNTIDGHVEVLKAEKTKIEARLDALYDGTTRLMRTFIKGSTLNTVESFLKLKTSLEGMTKQILITMSLALKF